MAEPMRPRVGQHQTEYEIRVTYYGPSRDCIELYGEADSTPLTMGLTAASDRRNAEVRVVASSSETPLNLLAALEALGEIHARAGQLGLAASRHDPD